MRDPSHMSGMLCHSIFLDIVPEARIVFLVSWSVSSPWGAHLKSRPCVIHGQNWSLTEIETTEVAGFAGRQAPHHSISRRRRSEIASGLLLSSLDMG